MIIYANQCLRSRLSSNLQVATSCFPKEQFPEDNPHIDQFCLHSTRSQLFLHRFHGQFYFIHMKSFFSTSLQNLTKNYIPCQLKLKSTTEINLNVFYILKVLSLHETIAAYKSVYFVGTIVPIVFFILGYIIKPAKPVRPKTRKTQ